MTTSAKIELTKKLLETLDYSRQIVGTTKTGRPQLINTPEGVGDWWVRDSKCDGLRLRLTPGSITWYVQRKMAGRKVTRAMGHYWLKEGAKDALSLDEARRRGAIWLGMMAQGIDPLRVKRDQHIETARAKERSDLTMRVAVRRLIEQTHSKASPATTADREKVAKWMNRSPMWSVPVAELTAEHVEGSLGPLLRRANGERIAAVGWGPRSMSPSTLNKIFAWSNGAWTRAAKSLAIPAGRGEGPFAAWRADQRWPKPKRKGGEVLLDTQSDTGRAWLKELVRLQTLAHDSAILTTRPDPRSKGVKPHSGVLIDYYLLVLLWGTRKTETALLRWSEVDFGRKVIELAPETTKAGALAVVPMTEWAEAILRARKAFNERWRPDDPSPYVFPSRIHGKPISTPQGVLAQLAELTGLRVRTHDLRHTLATAIGSEVDLRRAASLALASAALHHGKGRGLIGGATPIYLHEQVELLRDLYQKREDNLREIAGLPVPKRGREDGDELIDQVMNDPELKRRFFERLAQVR